MKDENPKNRQKEKTKQMKLGKLGMKVGLRGLMKAERREREKGVKS